MKILWICYFYIFENYVDFVSVKGTYMAVSPENPIDDDDFENVWIPGHILKPYTYAQVEDFSRYIILKIWTNLNWWTKDYYRTHHKQTWQNWFWVYMLFFHVYINIYFSYIYIYKYDYHLNKFYLNYIGSEPIFDNETDKFYIFKHIEWFLNKPKIKIYIYTKYISIFFVFFKKIWYVFLSTIKQFKKWEFMLNKQEQTINRYFLKHYKIQLKEKKLPNMGLFYQYDDMEKGEKISNTAEPYIRENYDHRTGSITPGVMSDYKKKQILLEEEKNKPKIRNKIVVKLEEEED